MNSNFYRYLHTPVDNSPLIFFRIVFGLLIFLESAGAIFTGWVKRVFIDPSFTFTFIGFEWLTPLPGYGMYFYYVLMAFFGLMVMIGMYYKFALTSFTLLWSATYFMQKTSYNNHYYLLILFCLIMLVLPAHRYKSYDAKREPGIKSLSCPRWCFLLIIAQVAIVYTFAAIAKIYPDWLNGLPVRIWFEAKSDYPLIGQLLQEDWIIHTVAYCGILFDLLIIPLMLWKRTRLVALSASIFFHLFNSIVFQIGIFPYLMLAVLVFFFDPEAVRKLFFKSKPSLNKSLPSPDQWEFRAFGFAPFKVAIVIYLLLQLYLPLRHWFYEGDVHWTEEGHRLAWQMMLRTKSGSIYFTVKMPETGEVDRIYPYDILTPKQGRKVGSYPDLIWQFSQHLKKTYEDNGYEQVEVYAHSIVSLNGKEFYPLIDEKVNLANVEWDRYSHSPWILSRPD